MDNQKLEKIKKIVESTYLLATSGMCRVCGCTYSEPCVDEDCNTCSWVTTDHTLCSFCFGKLYKETFDEDWFEQCLK